LFGCREIIYNPDMTGVAIVGITKIDGMMECWKSGIMGDRVLLPIFKSSISKLACPMRYLFLGKEATLWQSLS
jgi:hypothetical protein